MIYYLLFCVSTGSYRGSVQCNAPVRMPDHATCVFMGSKMDDAAYRLDAYRSWKCVGVPKALP